MIRKSNKEAIRLGAVGLATLGPIGLIYGVGEGTKLDIQKRHAKKSINALRREKNTLSRPVIGGQLSQKLEQMIILIHREH